MQRYIFYIERSLAGADLQFRSLQTASLLQQVVTLTSSATTCRNHLN